eukprot:Lithocolla_globosa_v1_NODE_93_length_6512_cov_4.841877.p5 type:complete len:138 gc:universal NODE_93_length_6512_cov_4.841877:912-1325(+)
MEKHKIPNKTMVNYRNGKIYRIVSDQTDEVYYGSTTQLLSMRMSGHRTGFRCWEDTEKYANVTSYQIMKYDDAKIVLVEKYECDSKEELLARERFYIENNDCVNKVVPQRSFKEYYQITKSNYREQRSIVRRIKNKY